MVLDSIGMDGELKLNWEAQKCRNKFVNLHTTFFLVTKLNLLMPITLWLLGLLGCQFSKLCTLQRTMDQSLLGAYGIVAVIINNSPQWIRFAQDV